MWLVLPLVVFTLDRLVPLAAVLVVLFVVLGVVLMLRERFSEL